MDRRYKRAEQRLTAAMLRLISKKAFHEITINDILAEADVVRKTFYTHYPNKEQLLWHSLEQHFQSIQDGLTDMHPNTLLVSNKPLSYPVYKHVSEFSLFYKGMLLENGQATFVFQFMDHIARQSFLRLQPLRDVAPIVSIPPVYMADLLSGALLGTLRWWLKNDLQDTPEQMAYRFSQFIAPGILQSMGLDDNLN